MRGPTGGGRGGVRGPCGPRVMGGVRGPCLKLIGGRGGVLGPFRGACLKGKRGFE